MTRDSGQKCGSAAAQINDLNALLQQNYVFIAKINYYVVCFKEVDNSYNGDVIIDGDANNKSWLSVAKWLDHGRLYRISDVIADLQPKV
jgi:hypothetical protein